MCLAVLALAQHPRFPLVLAANRDEFFDRPTAPLDWWQPSPDAPAVLAGRDLSAGGTWFGLTRQGRLALLTNVRDPANVRPDAPSRGQIVLDWLGSTRALAQASRDWQVRGYNGFNLIAADLTQPQWGWTGSLARTPEVLSAGLHGVSNASLNTPWPKVVRLRQQVHARLLKLQQHPHEMTVATLAASLFGALIDEQRAPDAALPNTGVSPRLERALSSIFIRTDDGRYGTRCSTVVIGERMALSTGMLLHVFERTYSPIEGDGELAHVTLDLAEISQADLRPLVQRQPQRDQGYRTTLSSTCTKSAAD